MANSTQRYVDNEKSKSFISGILNQEPVGVVQEVDIDLDVEKKISELQEAKLNGKSVNAERELKEWELGKQFANLLDNVGKEKEVTEEKIVKEEKKIEGLEKFATDRGHTILELAFAWLLSKDVVSTVIAGATKIEQIESNAVAADWVLTGEEVDEINKLLEE